MIDHEQKRQQLDRDGFCLLEGLIDDGMIARLRAVTDRVIARQEAAHFERQRAQGSLIRVTEDPFMARLIAYRPILQALARLGFPDPKWGSGFIISKPPKSPPLFWHQDARFWDDPISYTPRTIQCFLMIYLVDTTRHNGCLRLIPGSHLKRHRLHDALPDAHEDDLSRAADTAHLAFQRAEGEVEVPVKAGDVVMGGARLLHAAHGNNSDQRRTNITLWYYPDFANLPESIRAYLADSDWPADWQAHNGDLLEPLRPVYAGDTAPIRLNRRPGPALR
ncbi:MAG: phytanoyl-CoA dioxygenase family protein [Chloroflexi bacterium]|nr:phytanoyl-CoA dioxygenase family protein [Chloroflexota bacterium]